MREQRDSDNTSYGEALCPVSTLYTSAQGRGKVGDKKLSRLLFEVEKASLHSSHTGKARLRFYAGDTGHRAAFIPNSFHLASNFSSITQQPIVDQNARNSPFYSRHLNDNNMPAIQQTPAYLSLSPIMGKGVSKAPVDLQSPSSPTESINYPPPPPGSSANDPFVRTRADSASSLASANGYLWLSADR